MVKRASPDDTLAYLRALAARQAQATVEEADAENLTRAVPRAWDAQARTYVKPVRGGVPDAPVERHRPGCAAPTYRCLCGPVDVERFQAQTVGLKMRGASPAKPSMPRGELRTMQGSTGTLPKPARPIMDERDPVLMLDALPDFEPLPALTYRYADGTERTPPTSKVSVPVDTHKLCKQEQAKLHTRTVRAEHKLARAQARIAQLEGQLAALKAKKR